jgi:peptidoglycan/LPS O-acetylase OafA/YrhL
MVLLATCAAVLAWRCYLEFTFDPIYNRTYCATDTRIDSILFGCALAVWGNPQLDATRISETAWKYLLLPVAFAGLLATFVISNPHFLDTLRYTLQGLFLVPVFVVAIRYPNWGPMRVLNTRVLAWVGLISYSLYLVHLMVLKITYTVWGHHFWILVTVGWALAIGAAAAIHYAVERPAGRLRQRLHAQTRSRNGGLPAMSTASGRAAS